MPKQTPLLLIVVLAVPCLGCGNNVPSTPSEPYYDGHTLSYWLAEAKSDSVDARRGAADRLGFIRPPAIQALTELLNDKDERVRFAAVTALGNSGPNGILPLLESLKEKRVWDRDNSRSPASQGICTVGLLGALKATPAIPLLIELLKHNDAEVRASAAWSLGNIGPTAKAAMPVLMELFTDNDRKVRSSAMSALGGIGPEAKTAIPILSKCLYDEDGLVRCGAAAGLWGIGVNPEAKTAKSTIMGLLKDKDWMVRHAAAHVLGEKGPEAEFAVPALIELLDDREVPVRCNAAWALGEIGSKAKVAVPALTDLLDEDKTVQVTVIVALGRIGHEAGTAIPTLRRLLNDKDSEIRGLARDALQKIKPEQQ